MASSHTVRIEQLSKENYDTWKIQMEALLVKNDAWAYVSGEKVKPEIVASDQVTVEAARLWDVADRKAKSDIILSIMPSELKQVKGCTTAREVWLKLHSIYQSSGPARKATLLKQLTLQRMEDSGDVREHLRKFFDTVDKLNEMEVAINPDLLTVMLLYSLPPSFENFRCAIESRDELPAPDALRVKIVEENEARKNDSRAGETSAMIAKKPFGKRRTQNRKVESETTNEWKGVDAQKKTFKYKCHRCRKVGHKAVDCRDPTNRSDNANAADKVSFHAAAEYSHATEALSASNAKGDELWCLDSGCTAHMCNDSSEFTEIAETDPGKVNLASNASAEIRGKGIVSIDAEINGRSRSVNLCDALHVPDLRTNLISVGKITDKDFKVVFEKDSAAIVDQNGQTILIADRKDGLYYLREQKFEKSAIAKTNQGSISKANETEIWHRKMGHLNVKDLLECSRNGSVQGMNLGKSIREKFDCEICCRGKMTRTPFPKKSVKSSDLLEIIHSDVCGPMRVESNGKAIYFVTFIDDYSGWCVIHLLKRKDEVFGAFKDFKARVETRTGRKIKFLQSDNGREYRNEEFDSFLRKCGIGRRLTVTHTPQQNGVAERRNRTLLDMTRCLLMQSNLPTSFWGEAIHTANYIRNRCPSSSLGGKTAFEKWTGIAPHVSHFKVFGSEVYTLNREPNKGKFDSRSKKGIFVGYSEESKAYRVWLIEERKIDITRDIKCMENTTNFTIGNDYEDLVTNGRDASEQRVRETEVQLDLHQNQELDDVQHEDEDDGNGQLHDDQNHDTPRHGRGRPRRIMTGLRGRPRKEYQTATVADEITAEMAFSAEIPLDEAVSGPEADEWYQAMASELKSIISNDTWNLVDRPKNHRVIGSRVVLRRKYNQYGNLERRKARVVARGFSQRPGIEYNETYAPVARLGSVRTMMAVAAQTGMFVNQFDVTTAYLNGVLEEDVYMEVPKYTKETLEIIIQNEQTNNKICERAEKMLEDLKSGDKVCRLLKALYGLRQAGRCWNDKLDAELVSFGAKRSSADPCMYYRGEKEDLVIIAVYVDDIVVASRSQRIIADLKRQLSKKFQVKDLGDIKYCLGIEFSRNQEEITMCQSGYIRDILQRFGMSESKAVATPLDPGTRLKKNEEEPDAEGRTLPYRELIGALMYLAVCSRPDIAHAVSYLSQFNSCFDASHWTAAKRVLRYLKGTPNVGLLYKKTSTPLKGYVDADWANCPDDRRSYTGYVFVLSGCPVTWESRKQKTVALSSTEAEYMALAEATKEAVHLRRFLNELGLNKLSKAKIFSDNNGARKLAENPIFHNRSKHIDVRHHYIREVLGDGQLEIEFTPTSDMAADVLTKGLSGPKHRRCLELMGITKIDTFRSDHPCIEGEC